LFRSRDPGGKEEKRKGGKEERREERRENKSAARNAVFAPPQPLPQLSAEPTAPAGIVSQPRSGRITEEKRKGERKGGKTKAPLATPFLLHLSRSDRSCRRSRQPLPLYELEEDAIYASAIYASN
jgi:hypothetical protein